MSKLEVFKKILKETDDLFLRIDIDKIKEDHKIIDELGIDSLTRVTIFYEIQDYFDIEEDELLAANWSIVQDILDYIGSKS